MYAASLFVRYWRMRRDFFSPSLPVHQVCACNRARVGGLPQYFMVFSAVPTGVLRAPLGASRVLLPFHDWMSSAVAECEARKCDGFCN